jgi:hypothetical protein
MMARGFKPVGWVAAVAGAALGCYMLSLNVAAERAELAGIERRIIGAKQDIRSLQTELGTRGRLAQLDHWNAEVLALAAPTSAQFLRDEFTLARFDQREKTVEERAKVQLASAPAKPAKPDLKPAKIIRAAAPAPAAPSLGAQPATPMVRRAAVVIGADKPLATVRKAGLIDDRLVAAIGAAAKAEKRAGGQ